ncbi:histidine kinase [Lacibacter luteus]|uniref:Histidine kinase n=1 Tax=Lacibacter luteus TaxID=2508719 RepID=A0A4Q1CH42_9BACT|nr:FIST N-terminal domain-containing protein [Lacibacter luteus]RXK59393.1 histidine kinase [Lacibacter luteus]
MNTSIYRLTDSTWNLHPNSQSVNPNEANLVLCFSAKALLETEEIYNTLRSKFSTAEIAFCSTAGEIYQNEVFDNSFIAVAIQFEKTKVIAASVNISNYSNTQEAAISLASKLPSENLAHVLVFSDGALVNGSELVKGLTTQLPQNILITGGLAGDAANFNSTLVGLNKQPAHGEIVAIGLYGSNIKITHGSQGGWEMFGLEKRVTRSSANVLMEIEGQNALDLYKKYLGKEAHNLPSSALLFPLSVTIPDAKKPLVRTILSVNEKEKLMIFAGDIPVGSTVRFMKSTFDKLIAAADQAAALTVTGHKKMPSFSLLISCVGRKLILADKVVEEVKAVQQSYTNETVMAGFYSYGEISPFNEGGNCQLHNQTMTITSFYED